MRCDASISEQAGCGGAAMARQSPGSKDKAAAAQVPCHHKTAPPWGWCSSGLEAALQLARRMSADAFMTQLDAGEEQQNTLAICRKVRSAILEAGLTAPMLTMRLVVQDDEEYDDDEDEDDEDEDDELARKDSGIIITELNHDGSEKFGIDVRTTPMSRVINKRTGHRSSFLPAGLQFRDRLKLYRS